MFACFASGARTLLAIMVLASVCSGRAWAQFVPPQNLDPASATIRLDSSFQSDAWLVYTYDIDESGKVVNAEIQSSNGVLEVEQAVLRQVNAMRFRPARRGGNPVKVAADPVVYTWILDLPRAMSSRFAEIYQQAWDYYAREDYDSAFDTAVELKNFPGRNALEEVKFQILAASIASRWDDEAAELQHLSRVVEFQSLALNNNFNNTYVPPQQYLQILKRILTLQLNARMLADAGNTLDLMQALGRGSALVEEAAALYRQSEQQLGAMADVAITGELVPLYRDGPGSWKAGLSRREFSLSDVRGSVGAVFLVCADGERPLRYPAGEPWQIPAGWSDCLVDVSGKAGTRLVLHQYADGQR
ncbi:TonB family protein [Seongchinamella sediminis]|uniref:TonB family protein n=1 Tax=Seongchinamella sediminis TaxID=2283635 RepID=A0A3L7E0E1_9GAMM|nr:energy transducer TonB [Seongchinamella sediminis]RLQ22399.1 TonB family protein [Seongchinamella sediminis]